MKFYTVYTNPNTPKQIQFVPNGFSWFVLFLGAIGLLCQKSWIHGLIIFSICLILAFWFHLSIIIFAIIHFILACFAYSFRRRELILSGWTMKAVIAANNKDMAFLRFYDQYSELTQR